MSLKVTFRSSAKTKGTRFAATAFGERMNVIPEGGIDMKARRSARIYGAILRSQPQSFDPSSLGL